MGFASKHLARHVRRCKLAELPAVQVSLECVGTGGLGGEVYWMQVKIAC